MDTIILPFTLEEVEAHLYKKSYYEFFLACFNILEPQTKIVSNWHIQYICDQLQQLIENVASGVEKDKDLVINIPPRNFKSMLTTVCLNAWAWTNYPYIKFISCSYSGALAAEHCQKTRIIIESQWYQDRFGDVFQMSKDQNQKTFFQNDKGGERQISSTGSSATGKGGDIIIFDDILNPTLARSALERENAKAYYFQTMYSRLNNPKTGVRIIVEQRLHEEDITGLLLTRDKAGCEHICLPSEISNDISPQGLAQSYQDGLLFPDRLPKNQLEKLKLGLGSEQYATQYLQRPSPEGGLMIKSEWLQQRFIASNLPAVIARQFTSDTAYGIKNGGDYNATLCWSMHDDKLYCWNYYHSIDDFPTFLRNHKSFLEVQKYTDQSISYFEPKATGQSVIQTLKAEGINAKELPSPKDSKQVRVSSILAMLEAGRVYFQAGVDWSPLIEECKMFPNGKNDDLVDVFVNAVSFLKKEVFVIPEISTHSIIPNLPIDSFYDNDNQYNSIY
jgi:predicted phage terminase large subunit-like protein